MLNVKRVTCVRLYSQYVVCSIIKTTTESITEWRRCSDTSPTMLMFRNYKPTFEMSQYPYYRILTRFGASVVWSY